MGEIPRLMGQSSVYPVAVQGIKNFGMQKNRLKTISMKKNLSKTAGAFNGRLKGNAGLPR
jgi:hypothetical protein